MTLADMKGSGRTQLAVIIAAVAIGFIVELLPDSVFFPLFCYLPGRLAAIYYNTPLYIPELSFSAHGFLIVVTRSCGGSGFFALCGALLCVRAWQSVDSATTSRRFKLALWFVGAVALSWGITILVNAVRVILIVPVTAAAMFVPESFRSGIHMAAGMAAFMGAFIILWILTERQLPQKELK